MGPEKREPPAERQASAAQHQYTVLTIQLALRLVVETYGQLRCHRVGLRQVQGLHRA